jgi:hypothetical protein
LMFGQIAQLAIDNGEQAKKVAISTSEELPRKRTLKKAKPALDPDDIRYVVQLGHSKGLTTEEALEEKGYIRDVDELLAILN